MTAGVRKRSERISAASPVDLVIDPDMQLGHAGRGGRRVRGRGGTVAGASALQSEARNMMRGASWRVERREGWTVMVSYL